MKPSISTYLIFQEELKFTSYNFKSSEFINSKYSDLITLMFEEDNIIPFEAINYKM